MKFITITVLFLLGGFFSQAQESTDTTSTKLIRNKSILALPVIFRLPETGWAGGAVSTATWNWGKDRIGAKPSQASLGLTYTQNKQVLAFLPFNVFLANNKYYLNADIGWFKYNFYYYGIGENKVDEERYDVTYPYFELLASQQVRPNLYLGVRMKFQNYRITGRQEGGELVANEIEGSEYNRTSGIGPSILLDTRDNVFYPSKGVFGEVSIFPSSKIFGADRNFLQTKIDISAYKALHPKLILAGNFYGIFSKGDAIPFNQLAMLGGPKKMRGLYQGYFRDKNTALVQAELRWNFWKILAITGFGSAGVLGNEDKLLRLNLPKYTYGLGFRIRSKGGQHLRIDYGLSPYEKGNLYLTVGEAF